jgi:phenylacetate-CoA ligase
MHPLAVRYVILPLHERLRRRPTMRYFRQLCRSQWWATEQLRHHQQQKLRRLLSRAAAAPFWAGRLRDAAIDPIKATLDDLPNLPTLDKRDLRDHQYDMLTARRAAGLTDMTTGGSTGSPLHFAIDASRQASDQAARARSRRWFAIEPGRRELYLWGSPVELRAQDRLKSLRDGLTNHRLLDAFCMTPASMTRYLRELRRYDPVHLFGYPSSIARLFRFARSAGIAIDAPSLRAVFVTGEVFERMDRAAIEEAVAVPVADGYGSREGGFVAHQCPAGSYHVTMESHVVELLDEAGRAVAPGRTGEITLTHLDALAMPFIRYRTGDLARWADRPCPCGRGLESIESIEGRRTDMLRTTDGGHAHALSVIYVLRAEPCVAEFKVVQSANCDLDVWIVPREALDADCHRRIVDRLRGRIGPAITARLHPVARIEPDPSGKHRHVVGAG